MDQKTAEDYVRELYATALLRSPGEKELAHWAARAMSGATPIELLRAFKNGTEFQAKRRVKLHVPAGHFYSPIVDPDTVQPYFDIESAKTSTDIAGVKIDLKAMTTLWKSWRNVMLEAKFDEDVGGNKRYHTKNGSFPYGDAATLRAMIAHLKPGRIIEVGSGNSTACMLDTFEEFGLSTELTCIEPYPDSALTKILTSDDLKRLTLIPKKVQDAPLEIYGELGEGDILFIDSTHVVKTASDVHHEIFNILPVLKKGVVIHFHDCSFPFQYPRQWIYQKNWSWNEIFILRAFLMYNEKFSIISWASLMVREAAELVASIDPRILKEVGSGLWIRKTSL